MEYSYTMRLGLVACVLLASTVIVAGEDITDEFTSIVIEVPNPITIKAGSANDITVSPADGVEHVVTSGVLTISEAETPDTDATIVLTLDDDTMAALTKISAEAAAQITFEAFKAGTNQFTLDATTAGSKVTGTLDAPDLIIELTGGEVDLKGDIVKLGLTVNAKELRLHQTPSAQENTVKIETITGAITVNVAANSDVQLTLGPNAVVTGTTASTLCVIGGTCSVTAAPGFTGEPCEDCTATSSPSPETSSPEIENVSPSASPPVTEPSEGPWGCAHYHLWIKHLHGVDCSDKNATKNEYVKVLCHNHVCN